MAPRPRPAPSIGPIDAGASRNGTTMTNGAVPPGDEDLDAERARLEAELAATRTRIAVAKQRVSSRQSELEAAMKRELAAAREAIAAMERDHQAALAALRRPAAGSDGGR